MPARGLVSIVLLGFVAASGVARGESETLERLWEVETRGSLPQAIALDDAGRHLFVAMKSGGMAVFQLNAGASPPREVARLPVGRFARLDVMHLFRRGSRLFLALGDLFAAKGAPAGLAIVDVEKPAAPRVLGVWNSPEPMRGSAIVVADERRAYLGAMSDGVLVFDIADPARIRHESTFRPDVDFPRKNPNRVQHPNARGMALAGDRLHLAYDAGGLRVLDVSKPGALREIGRYANAAMGGKQQAFNNLVLDGPLAYVAVDYAGLEILDVSDPANVKPVGWWNPWKAHTAENVWFNSPGHTNQIAYDAAGKRAWLSAGDSELLVIDVSDPKRPEQVAHFGGRRDNRGAWGVTLADDGAYLACIEAFVPFRGTWSGIVKVKRPK